MLIDKSFFVLFHAVFLICHVLNLLHFRIFCVWFCMMFVYLHFCLVLLDILLCFPLFPFRSFGLAYFFWILFSPFSFSLFVAMFSLNPVVYLHFCFSVCVWQKIYRDGRCRWLVWKCDHARPIIELAATTWVLGKRAPA